MADDTNFMDELYKQHPALFELFNKDGLFIEKVNDQFVLRVIVIDEEIPLDKLNDLQHAWNDYILSKNPAAQPRSLIVTQNKS